jgi:transmembrane sensor
MADDGIVRRALADPEAAPLGRLLSDRFEERRVLGMWRGVDARLARGASPAVRLSWIAMAAAALLLVGWLALTAHAPGLTLATGSMPAVLDGFGAGSRHDLADGSRIELGAGSRLEVLRNDGHVFISALRRGTTTFEVKPGGPRQWVVEAGLATVMVVGTRFRVTRTLDAVDVQVERGTVVVRADALPGGERKLVAGQRVTVAATGAKQSALAPTLPLPPPAASAIPVVSVDALALADPEPARAAPVASASARVADPIDVLLAEADAARAADDHGTAVERLEAVLRQADARDPRRGMAALTLARLTQKRDPARAAEALSQSMEAMPGGLAQDALARQIEAEGRAGNRARAKALARDYLRRFPEGHHARDVQRWLEP